MTVPAFGNNAYWTSEAIEVAALRPVTGRAAVFRPIVLPHEEAYVECRQATRYTIVVYAMLGRSCPTTYRTVPMKTMEIPR